MITIFDEFFFLETKPKMQDVLAKMHKIRQKAGYPT